MEGARMNRLGKVLTLGLEKKRARQGNGCVRLGRTGVPMQELKQNGW